MPRHKPKSASKPSPAKKQKNITATPIPKKKKPLIISMRDDPTGMFAQEGYAIVRLDDNVTLAISRGKRRKDSKIAAEFSMNSFGAYVIKFKDPKLHEIFDKKLQIKRLLQAAKRKRK
jgi:hypothetical protein